MGKGKKPVSNTNPETKIKFLRNLGEEDKVHNDHGLAIIGRRDRNPQIPEEEGEKKEN